ncbi:MAG: glucosamine-6-phosphate deaminase [Chlorobi bacterium]|nr:glucosamine-6-phosphate deaminase [Chlorobiota bacterium]
MKIIIAETKQKLGEQAAAKGATLINNAIREKGSANIILATGASQFEMLAELVKTDVDWNKVTIFHLDEYIGLPVTHPASFRKYLKERFADIVHPETFHYINGENDPEKECNRLADLIGQVKIDVAFIGIGENGHIAFNDPPADFETEKPYLVVTLDEACRRQQMGEGWFASLEEVPRQAISMSVRQILKSKHIICSVPDKRKSEAIKNTVEGDVTPDIPASVLKQHPATRLYLDNESAALLKDFKYTS